MSTKVTVRNDANSNKCATILLRVENYPGGFRINSLLSLEHGHEVFTLDGRKYGGRQYQAWEAACMSGVFLIRKRANSDLFFAEIEQIAGCLDPGDATGFAVAASAAFLSEIRLPVELSDRLLSGWRIESIERV